MQLLTRYLFSTVEGLALLALFAGSPIVLALMSAKSIRQLHVVINGFLATLFSVPAGLALSHVKQGDGMGGLVFIIVGVGAGLLALGFLVGTISTGLILLVKREAGIPKLPKRHPRRLTLPTAQPLADQYARWKVTSRRPTASYQDFLEEAHPRYFPSSAWSIALAAVAMLVVGYLVLR